MTSQRISVVLPVYNEHLNIETCLRGLWAALSGVEHEILVCYDFDADSTLPAIAAMADKPPTVRLVKNDIGRGAANALRAGFHAASGDVVVTTMADLSDPPELIPAMAAKMRSEKAAVVSGSRYVKGGSQTGGPLFKRICSQTASLSLKWITGLSTHDATSNFRAYSRDYLDGVRIESKQGFEIALELTVKAHLAGLHVAEVPSSWKDRSAGESRFQLWKWAPNYLRWYWEAMAAPVFVWGVLLAMFAAALVFVARYSSAIPMHDDLEWAGVLGLDRIPPLDWWWSQFNEHRIPLPRLFFLALVRTTGDFRSGMYFDVALLGAVSAAMIVLARRLRGRNSYTDAFFPLLWLTWGNAENLLMMHQLSLVIPSAITCALLFLLVDERRAPTWKRGLAIGLCLVSLPLCGGPGLTAAPAIAAWLLGVGWLCVRSPEPGARAGGSVLLASAAATALLIGLYFVHFDGSASAGYDRDALDALRQSWMFVSLGFGAAAEPFWPFTGWAIGAVVLAAVVTLWIASRKQPAERLRIAGLAAVGAGILSMAVSTGIARGGTYEHAGFAMRYVTLPAPLWCCAYLAFSVYGPPAIGRFVRVSLVSALWLFVFFNVQAGADYGAKHVRYADDFKGDLEGGMKLRELAIAHWYHFYNTPAAFETRLESLRSAGFEPFENLQVGEEPEYPMLRERPMLVTSLRAGARKVDDTQVFLVPPECEMHFSLPFGKRSVLGRFGVYPLAYEFTPPEGVRFEVELQVASQPPRVIFERVLDTKARTEDRGFHVLNVELPPDAEGAIVLRTSFAGAGRDERAFGFWTEIRFR